MTTALLLTGGGARGAYQAGVVKALAEICAAKARPMPFRIICGTSAGAVNASFVAAAAAEFAEGAPLLAEFWRNLHTNEIFKTDAMTLGWTGMKWVSDLLLGRFKREKGAVSLLNTEPLAKLIASRVPFDKIKENLANNRFDAFEVTAMDYHNSESVSFVMGHAQTGWSLARRRGQPATIGLEHVMASSAIPLLFPPIAIGGRHYGDGCLRNPAPLSPAIRLGADRLFVVGVRHQKDRCELNTGRIVRPTIGRVMSVLLNSILMDATEFDIERLTHINEMITAVPEAVRHELPLRSIECFYLTPSVDLGSIAAERSGSLPDILRHLISGLGNKDEASELISYLFFEPAYTGHLVDLGYEDARAQRDAIEHLLFSQARSSI